LANTYFTSRQVKSGLASNNKLTDPAMTGVAYFQKKNKTKQIKSRASKDK